MNSLIWLGLIFTASSPEAPRLPPEVPRHSPKDFQGPEACAVCHPRHYLEWRGSAHAYSAKDPIVQACNRKALEDTKGEIGLFCLGCHAPLGVRTGEFTSRKDLRDASPFALGGVTCEICHRMEPPAEGKPIANASFELAVGQVVHGRLYNPAPTPAHESATSEFLGTSKFCGSCHDVLHNSALLEKSFEQWSSSVHKERNDQCQNCHMLRYSGQAAVGGPFRETLHRHNFPAVSVPLIPFPNRGFQSEGVKELLRTAARLSVSVSPEAAAGSELEIAVKVKNSGTGHNLPSGLSNERQVWVETTVTDSAGAVIFQSGGLDANGDLRDARSALEPGADPSLLQFSDRFIGADGNEVPFITLARRVDVHSIPPLEERSTVYRAPIPAQLEGSKLHLRVRLLFRFFPPYALRDLGLAHLARDVPIWEMAAFHSKEISVVRKLPRRTEYRVPGDFASIPEALQALEDGDTLLVAPGERSLDRPLDFHGKGITVRSLSVPELNVLRYAGPEEGAEAAVIVFRSGETSASRLEGFTLAGGRGILSAGTRRGGAIFVASASPSIVLCRIVESRARGGAGGGVYVEKTSLRLEDVRIDDCASDLGGGIAVADGSIELRGCSIQGCTASRGGGLHLAAGAAAMLARVEVAGNRAEGAGGGIFAEAGASWSADHATLVFNRAQDGAGAFGGASRGIPRVANSILWSNVPPGSSGQFSFCLIEADGLPPTNRHEAPLFMDPSGDWDPRDGRWLRGDYRLQFGSPGIDGGDPSAPADPDGTFTDIGAHYFEQPLRAFIRGDVGGDGRVDAADVMLLAQRILANAEVACLDAADVNDDGRIDPIDVLSLAVHVLCAGLAPAPPWPGCGFDPTPADGLSCAVPGQTCGGS
jgi:hypothetical protein